MTDDCSGCKLIGQPVPIALVRHHVRGAWQGMLEGREFSFCEDPSCPVVYFDTEGQGLDSSALRHAPAYKTGDGADLLCFCFDATGNDVTGPDDPTPFVRQRVRNGQCACEVLNPSGACCLGSIGRWKKDHV